jgi:flagellar basal body rod protein FlgG
MPRALSASAAASCGPLPARHPAEIPAATLRPGHVESSNVSSMNEMVKLIETMRHYEASQRIVQASDEMLEKALRKLASYEGSANERDEKTRFFRPFHSQTVQQQPTFGGRLERFPLHRRDRHERPAAERRHDREQPREREHAGLQEGARELPGHDVREAARSAVGSGVSVTGTARAFEGGELKKTESALDVAIRGDGFMEVTTPEGSTAYTRGGTLQVNRDGLLSNAQGLPLKASIRVPTTRRG